MLRALSRHLGGALDFLAMTLVGASKDEFCIRYACQRKPARVWTPARCWACDASLRRTLAWLSPVPSVSCLAPPCCDLPRRFGCFDGPSRRLLPESSEVLGSAPLSLSRAPHGPGPRPLSLSLAACWGAQPFDPPGSHRHVRKQDPKRYTAVHASTSAARTTHSASRASSPRPSTHSNESHRARPDTPRPAPNRARELSRCLLRGKFLPPSAPSTDAKRCDKQMRKSGTSRSYSPTHPPLGIRSETPVSLEHRLAGELSDPFLRVGRQLQPSSRGNWKLPKVCRNRPIPAKHWSKSGAEKGRNQTKFGQTQPKLEPSLVEADPSLVNIGSCLSQNMVEPAVQFGAGHVRSGPKLLWGVRFEQFRGDFGASAQRAVWLSVLFEFMEGASAAQ